MVELYQKCRIYAVSCQVLVLLALFPGLGAELRSGPCWSRKNLLCWQQSMDLLSVWNLLLSKPRSALQPCTCDGPEGGLGQEEPV